MCVCVGGGGVYVCVFVCCMYVCISVLCAVFVIIAAPLFMFNYSECEDSLNHFTVITIITTLLHVVHVTL